MFHLICNPQPTAPAVKPLAEMTKAELIAAAHVANLSNDPADQPHYQAVLNALSPRMSTKDYLSLLDDLEAALPCM